MSKPKKGGSKIKDEFRERQEVVESRAKVEDRSQEEKIEPKRRTRLSAPVDYEEQVEDIPKIERTRDKPVKLQDEGRVKKQEGRVIIQDQEMIRKQGMQDEQRWEEDEKKIAQLREA